MRSADLLQAACCNAARACPHLARTVLSRLVQSAHALQDASKAKLRFCMFNEARRLGVFGSLPLLSGTNTPNIMLGARYTSPELTAGAMVRPLQEQIDAVWAVSAEEAAYCTAVEPCTGPGPCRSS